MWDIEVTAEYTTWYRGLTDAQRESVQTAVEALEVGGPALRRPFVGILASSRFPNMKELRPPRGNLRIIFAFDPRRSAILLLGGDKTGRWEEWYERAIPKADSLYDVHLTELKKKGLI